MPREVTKEDLRAAIDFELSFTSAGVDEVFASMESRYNAPDQPIYGWLKELYDDFIDQYGAE